MDQRMAIVLVVDDDERMRRLVRDLLTSHNYRVVTARDGAEAISVARSEKPDVILMDVFMPKMDGYAALDELKKDAATKGIPVVMLTAVGYDLNKRLAEQFGSSGYLTKPFSTKDLLETIGPFVQTRSEQQTGRRL